MFVSMRILVLARRRKPVLRMEFSLSHAAGNKALSDPSICSSPTIFNIIAMIQFAESLA